MCKTKLFLIKFVSLCLLWCLTKEETRIKYIIVCRHTLIFFLNIIIEHCVEMVYIALTKHLNFKNFIICSYIYTHDSWQRVNVNKILIGESLLAILL